MADLEVGADLDHRVIGRLQPAEHVEQLRGVQRDAPLGRPLHPGVQEDAGSRRICAVDRRVLVEFDDREVGIGDRLGPQSLRPARVCGRESQATCSNRLYSEL